MLSHDTPLMAMNNVSTCKITPSLKQSGDTFELELSCQNETAAGKGCITTSQLHKEVVSLVETFFSPTMSENDLSLFLRLHVQPMLEAAPEVMACPHVDNMVGQALMSISSQVETTLHKKMPHCHSDVLSFWTLPPQHFHRSMTFRNISMDVTVKLPAGNSWSVFDRLLSSEDRHKVLVGIKTETCNGLTVDDFSNNTLQIASLMRGIASEVPSLGVGLRAEVMSFAIIVDAIRDGVEKVMALSTATLPLGLAVLMYMVGNARLVIIAVINVLGAVAGSVLVMNHIVIKLMPVSIFTPPFLIAVVLAMSIDYSLFLLSRFQKETERFASPEEALRIAMATSGRIVVQAAITLACCFSCVLMIPVEMVSAMGAGGLAAVCMAMVSSITLTPALILLRPSFWISYKAWPCCQCSKEDPSYSSPFWQGFGRWLKKWAAPLWLFTTLAAVPCLWEFSRMPPSMVGFLPALPVGSSAGNILQDMGEAFGYEAIFPTTLAVISPEGVGFEEWRSQSCHALQEIGKQVQDKQSDFSSSLMISEIILAGKCLSVDVNGSSLLRWRRSSRAGSIVYLRYPANPLSASGQDWISSLHKAVAEHQVGTWFVRGVGPLIASQAQQIEKHFPWLLLATLCIVLVICTAFTCSCFSSLRALFCLSWMLVLLWAVSNWLFPQGLYFVVPPMMLPFLVGVALDYDIFYTEAVLEECKTRSCSAEKAGIDVLGNTANTITAAGLIMILAFLPLLLSSTTVLRQIGFMAIGGLFISAFWNTKVVMPLCVLLLKKYSFWPRNFEQKPAVDAIFLAHPSYLVNTFCLFSSPDAEKRWSPSWWMYLFLPLLWLIAFCSAHGLRRLGLPNYLVLDDFKYHGLRVQTWAVLHFGRHFRNSCELHDARRNVVAAVLAAEKTGARVLGLGALNKAEFLNRGGLDLLEELPTDRHMRITHGDQLTAAAVVETVKRLVAKLPGPVKPFLTGATSKTGKAVALALLQQGISVICHSSSLERREELESYGLETASKLRHGAESILWIVGKFDPRWCVQTFSLIFFNVLVLSSTVLSSTPVILMFFGGLEIANQDKFVNDVMPPFSIACVFAVPNPVFRPDVKIIEGATLHIDESRLEGQRANLTLRRREIFACNAGALHLASQQTDEDDLGPVEPETLENYLQGAESIGITLPQPLL